jgi:hypothetical protein
MIKRKVIIYNYVFDLYFSSEKDNVITKSVFWKQGISPASMTEEEFKQGQIYQQEILNSHWDWIIFKKNHFSIPEFKIEVKLDEIMYDGSIRWNLGEIKSGMKVICPHCNDSNCNFDCVEALSWASDINESLMQDKKETLESYRNSNYGIDAIESLILGHACAGVDISSTIYIEGLRSAINGFPDNI